MGKPAARIGDMTAHGGTITVGCPTVLIGGMPAARVGDFHMCPMVTPGTPPIPHVGGPVNLGSSGVMIGGMPAARVGDMAVCTGPPDTIAMGCFTVLIGETGGGGGGAGAGGSLAAASTLGAALASSEAEVSRERTDESHWIEFDFVDAAGNPVSGVPYEFTGTDGEKDSGFLRGDGVLRRDWVPAGTGKVKLFSVTNAEWSTDEAETGDTVQLTADVDGFEPGTPAEITIFERDIQGGDDVIETIETEVRGGTVETEWTYRLVEEDDRSPPEEGQRYVYPEYYFSVRVGRCRALSGLLFYKDWVEIEMLDEEDNPVPNAEYRFLAPNGEVRQGELDQNGTARLENLPPGKGRVRFRSFGRREGS